ncbi:MAG: hypothetical protein GXO58_04080 [Thermodesulfobacteria bacterium]|nr:hypothetical protein [Thermodesulfobacteriota bacterium]
MSLVVKIRNSDALESLSTVAPFPLIVISELTVSSGDVRVMVLPAGNIIVSAPLPAVHPPVAASLLADVMASARVQFTLSTLMTAAVDVLAVATDRAAAIKVAFPLDEILLRFFRDLIFLFFSTSFFSILHPPTTIKSKYTRSATAYPLLISLH